MFGKPLAYYLGLQAPALSAILAVFAIRLFIPMEGVPESVGRMLSITTVIVLTLPYYALIAKREGLTFKHLYAMCFLQGVFSQTLIGLAISMAILTGRHNIYTLPAGNSWVHAIAHVLFAGALILPLATLAVTSVLLVIARKVKSW